MTFPTPLDAGARPQPFAIGNNLAPGLGIATFETMPAPTRVGRLPRGVRRPLVVTLQGFVEDSASQSPQHVSVTNAVVLTVAP
ncbi:MAG: hypothetical protein HYR85_17115 [Planctomycetes bacterium]|nr:hypothetical protein [Planctomycetota bacterium]MBI3845361.1 hypothetical protein [Planctomycetota bacterium]